MTAALGVRLSAVGLAILLCAPLTASRAQVRFERTGFRMTSIGERITLSGRVLDARRRPVATGRIRWRVADPSIASVSAQGVVVSRKTGNTRLWAISGQDSTSALIVVDQWAAKFDFAPALLRLDAVGAKTPLRIAVRDAEGHVIAEQNRKATACRSLNERVASLATNGEVTAKGNGTTFVRCVDRGIADSVRIEVRQRPARVSIADKTGAASKIVGDTLRMRINAVDRQGDAIAEPQSRWASLNPSIVSVDPVTGFARMIGGGTARVVVQVGDVSDTATVAVAPGFGQAVPANSDSTTVLDLTPRVPTLDIDPVNQREGDQASVTVRARDPQGNEVTNAAVVLRSSDTSVFVVEGSLRIRAKKPGSAFVHGRFGVATDSASVTVRSLAAVAALDTTAERRRREAFVRPTFPDDSLRRVYGLVADSARNQMFRGSVVARGASGRMIALNALGGTAAYTFSDDSSGQEKRSGVVYGGAADVAPFRWLKIGGAFKKGTLTATEETLGNAIALTEASAALTYQPVSWLGARLGILIRAMNDSIALQKWTIPSGSVIIRLPLVGGQVTTVAAISLLSGATYSGTAADQQPDPLSMGGEAGIEFQTGWLNAGILYSVEALKIETLGRSDKFSTLRLRLGLQRGR